ncbi:hypothetical protein ACPXB5_11475 [Micromonospora arida]|uniref:hypothetical protein n=1 Tax=Micromonospora arida TaxID=2203715 RepID=UPI003CF46D40
MTSTTAAKLTAGARVYAIMTDEGPSFAKSATASGVEIATLTAEPAREGRKLRIESDCGSFEVGGAAKVLLASADDTAEDDAHREKFDDTAEAAEEPAQESAIPEVVADEEPEAAAPIIAFVTTDDAGRLTHFSKLRVAGDGTATERPVPWKVDVPGGAIAPIRLAFVLRELGYRPAGRWVSGAANEVTCPVVPLAEDE